MRTGPRPWVYLALLLAPVGAAVADDDNNDGPRARGTFTSCIAGTTVTGRAILQERPSAEGVKVVDVALFVNGLPAGKHAVHIHEVGACAPTCAAAGSHFDPGPASNTVPVEANHPFHSGDLVNVQVGSRGCGALSTTTSRVTVSPGPLSIFDANGSSIVIHVAPDEYCPAGNVAGCAGGARAACAVLTLDN